MNNVILTEAFKELKLLEEEDFNINSTEDMEDAKEFIEDDIDVEPVIEIADVYADEEGELLDSYVGKVILECEVCHSKIFEDSDKVTIDEEENVANMDQECPYCFSNDGYKVIGQVAPFGQVEEEITVEEEPVEDEIADDIEAEDGIVEESLRRKKRGKKINESRRTRKNKKIFEAANSKITIDLDNFVPNEDESKDDIKKWMKSDYNLDLIKYKYDKDGMCYIATIKGTKDDILNYLTDGSGYGLSKEEVEEYYSELLDESLNESVDSIVTITLGFVNGNDETEDEIRDWLKSDYNLYLVKYDPNNFDDEATIRGTKEDLINYITGDYSDGDCDLEWIEEFYPELLDESLKECGDCKNGDCKDDILDELEEDFKDVSITTDDSHMTMTSDDEGKVTVTTEPVHDEFEDDFMADDITGGDEMIAPLDDETVSEIEGEEEIEEPFAEEPLGDEEDIDIDIDEFDEEGFDGLGESYLKKVYENVNSFKTTGIREEKNKLYVEGLIGFDSGNKKKTSFIFEAKDIDSKGKIRFIGENKEITRGKKSFTVAGRMNGKKFMCESFNYNYRAKDENGKSTRLYGTIKK